MKVKAHNNKDQFAFCSLKGCERVKITVVIPEGSLPSNCMARAYPKHAELPTVDVPMPKKIPNNRLVRKGRGHWIVGQLNAFKNVQTRATLGLDSGYSSSSSYTLAKLRLHSG